MGVKVEFRPALLLLALDIHEYQVLLHLPKVVISILEHKRQEHRILLLHWILSTQKMTSTNPWNRASVLPHLQRLTALRRAPELGVRPL